MSVNIRACSCHNPHVLVGSDGFDTIEQHQIRYLCHLADILMKYINMAAVTMVIVLIYSHLNHISSQVLTDSGP